MEVSISAMCEHFRVPTCLVCCGFVITRDVSIISNYLWPKDDLVRFDPTGPRSISIILWLWFFKGLASGGILAWWV
ncbi:unnamed protein product [Sphagnum balticum]